MIHLGLQGIPLRGKRRQLLLQSFRGCAASAFLALQRFQILRLLRAQLFQLRLAELLQVCLGLVQLHQRGKAFRLQIL